MPITGHRQTPLQAPPSSACGADKDGVAVDFSGLSRARGKAPVLWEPSVVHGERPQGLISPSHLCQQVTSLCERPPFRQLQQDRTTSILTDQEGGVRKKLLSHSDTHNIPTEIQTMKRPVLASIKDRVQS